MDEAQYVGTRDSLHAVAELLIAGPQYRQFGTIRLGVVPGGFGGVKLPVSVVGDELVWADGRALLSGSYREIAERAGVAAEAPTGLYRDTTGADPADPVRVDAEAAAVIAEWLATGDAALRNLLPELTPVLWPEHFDLSVTADEVNYGVSPGDAGHPGPYAYVGPWHPRTGDFWNASFGALRPLAEVRDVPSLLAFFEEGRARATETN
ncbi:hypothetical protein [Nocardia sp. NPDC052566]|uniref:hypothetical protein n=1 Tax=Nocardia sp. NPDC052566 TaxID=3364330 RepID=UPI0037CCB69F